ncbi:Zinc finger BED domain-containing protein DAYSLEEPER, partial [Linum grandiflorum]
AQVPQQAKNAQQAENVEVVPLGNCRKREVWDHFDRIKVHGILKAKCHYCRKLLGGHSTSGTSHLWNHINICIHKKIHDGRQKIMGPKLVGKSKRDVPAITYNAEVSRKELAIAIVMHEYPLSMVDHLYFKLFICSLQPQFTVPSRNTIKKDIMSIYMTEKTKIQRALMVTKKVFQSSPICGQPLIRKEYIWLSLVITMITLGIYGTTCLGKILIQISNV